MHKEPGEEEAVFRFRPGNAETGYGEFVGRSEENFEKAWKAHCTKHNIEYKEESEERYNVQADFDNGAYIIQINSKNRYQFVFRYFALENNLIKYEFVSSSGL